MNPSLSRPLPPAVDIVSFFTVRLKTFQGHQLFRVRSSKLFRVRSCNDIIVMPVVFSVCRCPFLFFLHSKQFKFSVLPEVAIKSHHPADPRSFNYGKAGRIAV